MHRGEKTDVEVAEELYQIILRRKPTERELTSTKEYLGKKNREVAGKDVIWAMMNSKEFANW